MAYSLDSLRDNPVPRFTDFVDGQEPKLFRKDQIPQGMLDHLDKNVDYLERIGVKIGPDRKVPKKHGVPRIFILKKDARGVERQVDLADAGINPARLDELRRLSTSAAMNDNRLAAARLLTTYEH